MRRRRDDGVPEPLRHYLLVGCWCEPRWDTGRADLDVFLLAGAVMAQSLDGLRNAWADAGARVKKRHRGETFAEKVLKRGAWASGDGTCTMREHGLGEDACG